MVEGGQPAKLWLAVSHPDFSRAGQVSDHAKALSKVEKVTKSGASGAYLRDQTLSDAARAKDLGRQWSRLTPMSILL